ncbi:hypothetical protein LBMAG47_24460 [Planctomycetia bacterium]|nr:hypothetical protein LBMAG47_24460 [Planctomycetia bacterium]
MGGPLADADQIGNLRDPDVGILRDAHEHVGMVREKRPRRPTPWAEVGRRGRGCATCHAVILANHSPS